MLKHGKINSRTGAADRNKSGAYPEHAVTLKWTYNYFSVGSDEAIHNWRENLPLSLREALANE